MFHIHPWQNGFDLSITGHFLEVHVSEDDETCLYCRCNVTRGQGVKSMCKNGLSPKMCQLFKTQLTYMGNEFSINKRTMTFTPLRSRTEAINKIPTPRTPKQCKCFCGVVNYLSLFCLYLQKLLKPIVELTRKDRPFIWGDAQEKAFREVKLRLTNHPVWTCLKQKEDLFCIQILVLKELVVH